MPGISKLKLIEIANRIPLFKALDAHEKEQVVSIPKIVKAIKAGERFITFGEHNDSFYILLSGMASVYQKEKKIAVVHGGQFVGEVGFICSEARTANVIADTDLITFRIDKTCFNHLPLVLRDKIKDKLINGLVDRVEEMNSLISALQVQINTLQPLIDQEKAGNNERVIHIPDDTYSEKQEALNEEITQTAEGMSEPLGSPWCDPDRKT